MFFSVFIRDCRKRCTLRKEIFNTIENLKWVLYKKGQQKSQIGFIIKDRGSIILAKICLNKIFFFNYIL
jgi:hypothetical protein